MFFFSSNIQVNTDRKLDPESDPVKKISDLDQDPAGQNPQIQTDSHPHNGIFFILQQRFSL